MINGIRIGIPDLLRSIGNLFSPLSLFANNEQGLWYDPSDINNYMGGLGSELITNGDFSNGTTNWEAAAVVSNVGGATISVTNGVFRVTNNSSGVNFGLGSQAVSCVVGKTYVVTLNRVGQSITTTLAKWHVGTAPNDAGLATNILANQVNSTNTFVAPSTTVYINLGAYENNANAWAEWDNISVKEVTSIANATMFQDAAGTIPVTTVEQPVGLIIDKRNGGVLNPQLVTNSTFDTDTDWTKGTGWTIGSGVATKTAGTASLLAQSKTLVTGKTYRIVYTITRTAGTFTVQFRGGSTISGTARSASGTYVDFITAVSGNNSLNFEGSSLFAGTVDNIYMQEVTGNDGCQTTSASRPTLSARYNLISYSEQFNIAPWGVSNSASTDPVITANNVIAPNGYQTADTIVFGAIDAAGDYSVVSQVLTLPATQNYTRSMYIKATTAGDIGKNVYFYVTDVTIKDVLTITLTADWQRVTKTLSMASGVGKSFTFGTLGSTYGGANQVSVSADVWGYQVVPENDSVGLLNYQRVNTATDYDTTGFLPYLSYDGTDDHMLSQTVNLNTNTSDGLAIRNLLTLPAKFDNAAWTKTNSFVQSNFILYSEDFSNVAWAKTNATISPNAIVAPDGTLTADKIIETVANGVHSITTASTFTGTDNVYTLSFYLKADTRTWVQVGCFNTTTKAAYFDLTNVAKGTEANCTGTISDVGNGWRRVQVVFTATSAGVISPYVVLATADNVNTYTGDGTSGIYATKAQLVLGSVAGDYRETYGVAAPVFYSNYNGTVSAQKLIASTVSGVHSATQIFTPSTGVTYTASYYVKKGEYNWCAIELGGSSLISSAYFDLQNGVVGTTVNSPTTSITPLGDGWFRCSITKTSTGTVASYSAIFACTADNTASFAGNDTSGIYLSNAQLEVGTSASAYQTVGTDVVTVVAGQRKLRDSASGPLVFSAQTGTAPIVGSFALYAPGVGSNTSYRFTNRGSLAAVNADTGVTNAAPHTGIVSGIGSISDDLARIRVNGTTIATTSTDQGTGNYAAASGFLIGRNGTGGASYYQGRIYSLIVRMTASTDTQIANTEKYVNSKTKAY